MRSPEHWASVAGDPEDTWARRARLDGSKRARGRRRRRGSERSWSACYVCGPVSIETKAARGVAWNMATGVGTRVFGLVGTLALTRFIAPAEFGEVSAAAICVLSATQLTFFAVGQ